MASLKAHFIYCTYPSLILNKNPTSLPSHLHVLAINRYAIQAVAADGSRVDVLTGTLAPGWDITKVNGGQPADKICTLGTITKFGGETGCYNHETLFVDDETLPTSKRVCSIATTPILLDPTKDSRLNLACPTGYYCPLTGIVIKYFSLYSVYVPV